MLKWNTKDLNKGKGQSTRGHWYWVIDHGLLIMHYWSWDINNGLLIVGHLWGIFDREPLIFGPWTWAALFALYNQLLCNWGYWIRTTEICFLLEQSMFSAIGHCHSYSSEKEICMRLSHHILHSYIYLPTSCNGHCRKGEVTTIDDI